jgi:hypothetical protein
MKKRKQTIRRRLKSAFKPLSSVKKEVGLLRDWANRNAEVEFIVPLAGGSIKYFGRIVDTTVGDANIPMFHFISPSSGMQATLMPQTFGKTRIEKVANVHNGVYVEGKAKDAQAFWIVESLFGKKPPSDFAAIVEKLRTWERLQLDLHVLLNRGGHAISFLGQVRELAAGIFSFVRPPDPVQLLIRLDEYSYMTLNVESDKTSVTLIDPPSEEMFLISDVATQPETVFDRFIGSPTIH